MWQRRMKYLSELLEWKGYHWKSGLPPGIELFLYTCLLELFCWIWPTLCFGIIHNIPRYVGQPWNQQNPRSLLYNFTFVFSSEKCLVLVKYLNKIVQMIEFYLFWILSSVDEQYLVFRIFCKFGYVSLFFLLLNRAVTLGSSCSRLSRPVENGFVISNCHYFKLIWRK